MIGPDLDHGFLPFPILLHSLPTLKDNAFPVPKHQGGTAYHLKILKQKLDQLHRIHLWAQLSIFFQHRGPSLLIPN